MPRPDTKRSETEMLTQKNPPEASLIATAAFPSAIFSLNKFATVDPNSSDNIPLAKWYGGDESDENADSADDATCAVMLQSMVPLELLH